MALFFGGIPTESEVKILREAFPSLKAGDMVTYEEITKFIHSERGESRFRTVLEAFRRYLRRTRNQETDIVRNEGMIVLTEKERVDLGIKTFVKGIRQGGRGGAKVRAADREQMDEVTTRKAEVAERAIDGVLSTARASVKEIAKLDPPARLPRLTAK